MAGVGRDLCGSPSPTTLLKQGYPEQAAQDHVQVGFEYLQRRRLHSPSGQPGPGLRHPPLPLRALSSQLFRPTACFWKKHLHAKATLGAGPEVPQTAPLGTAAFSPTRLKLRGASGC